MSGVSQGVNVDAGWFADYIANPPQEAQQRINGDTPLHRVELLRERWEKRMRGVQLQRFASLRDPRAEQIEDADDTLDLIPELARAWISDMDAGVLDPEQVLKNIAEIPAILQVIAQTYVDAERDAEAAYAMVDLSPADYTARLAERFPSLRDSGPYVTEAWLRGEPGAPDPLRDN